MAARKSPRRGAAPPRPRTSPPPQTSTALKAPLPAGTPAPDFTLHSTPDQMVTLSEFRGQPVVLAFYPADWSPVCGDQLALYNELLSEFHRYNAELIGISVDGVWCHAAFASARNLHFPLLADFEPKGRISMAYGAFSVRDGQSSRSLFVIDGAGTIRWSYQSPMGVNPGADGILAALESLAGDKAPAADVRAHPPGRAPGRKAVVRPSGRSAPSGNERASR